MSHTLSVYDNTTNTIDTEYRVSVRRFTEIDIVAERRNPFYYVHILILLDESNHVAELKAYRLYNSGESLAEEKLYAHRYTSNNRWIFVLDTVEKWLKEV